MRRARNQLLAITLVATALCADRVATAAPQLRATFSPSSDPIARLATNLGSRLSGTFRRARVTVMRLQPTGPSDESAPVTTRSISHESPAIHRAEGSPFRFRLPPPALA